MLLLLGPSGGEVIAGAFHRRAVPTEMDIMTAFGQVEGDSQ